MIGFSSFYANGTYRAAYALGEVFGNRVIDLQQLCKLSGEDRDLQSDVPFDLAGLFKYCGESDTLLEMITRYASKMRAVGEPLDDAESGQLLHNLDGLGLGPAVTTPGKIICVGMNYPTPGVDTSKQEYPTLFLKAASTLTGHLHNVVIPRVSQRVFCEGELAIVIGKRGKHISPDHVWDYVAGLTIGIDIGAEDLEARTSQWQTGKLPDTFTPLGPCIVPTRFMPQLDNLTVRVFVNDQLMLSGNTSDMIFPPAFLIQYLSEITTLEPGDIILTGCPKSVKGQATGKAYIAAGDSIRVQIESLGELINPVTNEEIRNG